MSALHKNLSTPNSQALGTEKHSEIIGTLHEKGLNYLPLFHKNMFFLTIQLFFVFRNLVLAGVRFVTHHNSEKRQIVRQQQAM